MRLAVMSDSHGYDERIDEVIQNEPADYYLHLGDICSDYYRYHDLIVVRGNNDYSFDLQDTIITEFNGLRILMCHSHQYMSYSRKDSLVHLAKKNDCQMVLYGHTHLYSDDVVDTIRLLNPGSLLCNRDYSTIGYLVIDIEKDGSYQVTRKFLKDRID